MSKKSRGPNGERYFSSFNTRSKNYHFGICELSPYKAKKALFKEIGKDAYNSRWEIRQIAYQHPYVKHAYRVKKLNEVTE